MTQRNIEKAWVSNVQKTLGLHNHDLQRPWHWIFIMFLYHDSNRENNWERMTQWVRKEKSEGERNIVKFIGAKYKVLNLVWNTLDQDGEKDGLKHHIFKKDLDFYTAVFCLEWREMILSLSPPEGESLWEFCSEVLHWTWSVFRGEHSGLWRDKKIEFRFRKITLLFKPVQCLTELLQ